VALQMAGLTARLVGAPLVALATLAASR